MSNAPDNRSGADDVDGRRRWIAVSHGPAPARSRPSAAQRYRSLRDMSGHPPESEPEPAAPPNGSAWRGRPGNGRPADPPRNGTHHTDERVPAGLRDILNPEQSETKQRWTPRRRLLTAALALAALVLLAGLGYGGYSLAAPYFGLGYDTGGSVRLDNVRLTVTGVRCGINHAPNGSGVPPEGSYCAVDISASNQARTGEFVDLRAWSADLDVGIDNVRPTTAAMNRTHGILEGESNEDLHLVYDVPTGARLHRLHLDVADATGTIKVS